MAPLAPGRSPPPAFSGRGSSMISTPGAGGERAGLQQGSGVSAISPARALADAFALVPGEEVKEILLRRVSQAQQAQPGTGNEGVSALEGASAATSRVEGPWTGYGGDSAHRGQAGSPADVRVAEALADACRDIVLECLLGAREGEEDGNGEGEASDMGGGGGAGA